MMQCCFIGCVVEANICFSTWSANVVAGTDDLFVLVVTGFVGLLGCGMAAL